MANNSKIFRKNLERYIKTNFLQIALRAMSQAADDIVRFIENTETVPVDTGNLRDSTGVGVYIGGALLYFKPVQIADEPRVVGPTIGEAGKEYWGTDELTKAIELAATEYSNGYYLVIFSTMPYAFKVEETSSYFYGNMTQFLMTKIKEAFSNEGY